MEEVLGSLKAIYSSGRVLLCISGGLDSAVLAFAFRKAGIDLSLFFATSPIRAYEMKIRAELVSEVLGVPLYLAETKELKNTIFLTDPQKRCYECKKVLYEEALKVAASIGATAVCDGTNLDDLREGRPGIKAAEELGIRFPLVELKLGKKDILRLNEALQVRFPTEPTTCFATRFPDKSHPVRAELFDFIHSSERFLKNAGFRNVRVRILKNAVLYQVDKEQVGNLLELKKLLKYPIGYELMVDSCGYRNLSRMLEEEE